MNQNSRILIAAILVGIPTVLASTMVLGQTRSHSTPRPRGTTTQASTSTQHLGEEDIQKYVNRYEYYLRHLDTNHNGFLEQQELQGRGAVLAAKMAQKAGVELSLPMPIHRIRDGLIRQLRSQGGASAPSTGSATTPGTPAPADSDGGSSESKVPGFGADGDPSSVPGFGGGEATAATPSKSSSSPHRSSGSSSSSSSDDRVDYRIRRYAQSLLKQYDKNKNGKLEKEEWSKMRNDPEKADRNKDGIITLDELTRRLADYSGSRHGSSSSSHSSGSSSRDSSSWKSGHSHSHSSRSSDKEKPKGYRFLTPTERLPSGLPDWFAQRDTNGDGQVSMAEYSQSWTNSKAKEFVELDLNGDGVVTPTECLSEKDSE